MDPRSVTPYPYPLVEWTFTPPPPAYLPVAGNEERFPIHRIYCVGRNYAAHVREMGGDPDREKPFFFSKPADAIVQDRGVVRYPPSTEDLHHEVELVVAIGTGARENGQDDLEIPIDRALDHIFGYAVGVDLTRRDLQSVYRKAGQPWDMAKGFDQSAPCGAIRPAAIAGHVDRGRIRLEVNRETRQDADLGQLIWSVPEIINHLSKLVEIKAGDLIFTGTPEGVAAVRPGDELDASIDRIGRLSFTIEHPYASAHPIA